MKKLVYKCDSKSTKSFYVILKIHVTLLQQNFYPSEILSTESRLRVSNMKNLNENGFVDLVCLYLYLPC